MSFPHQDPRWTEVVAFLARHAAPTDDVLAPDLFWWTRSGIWRHRSTWQEDRAYDWAVLHKGRLAEMAARFLTQVPRTMHPVFANEVFVVWSRDPQVPGLPAGDIHVETFHQASRRARPHCPETPPDEPGLVLPDPDRIEACRHQDRATFARTMDAYWRAGGYRYDTLRDRAYLRALDDHVGRFLATCQGSVLDLACGNGRPMALPAGTEVHGIDIAASAIEIARQRHAAEAARTFDMGDVHDLPLAAGSQDHVLFVDAIEHVHEPEQVLDELARVLRPGGTALVTAANRDSLNQVLMRRRGLPEFVTNWQHIREFTLAELRTLLESRGLTITDAQGLFLYPYWGVPGVDDDVRDLTDEDPEIVELLRILGERVGPEHAYTMVLTLRRQD